jgi:LAO/AO transport system kinase
MASRGALGGLAEACGPVILFLESRGWNIIIIETVGAGQDHIEVRKLADTVIVVLSPNLGDEVQHFKAGLMEVGDLYVVNKSDLAGADRMTQQVRSALAGESRRSPAVIKVSAKKRLGIEALINETKNHRTRLSHVALIALRRERIAALLKRATNSYAMKIIQKKVAGKFDFERMAQVFVESKVSPRRMIQAMKKELDSAI